MSVKQLDPKHVWLIQELHGRISAGTYGESDVFSLLVLLRPWAREPLREFGHAMAHRERDRGQILSYLRESYNLLNSPPEKPEDAVKEVLYIRGEIGKALNEAFADLKLSTLDTQRTDDLAVVVASLLQGLTFADCGIRKLRFDIAPRFVGVWGEITGPGGNVFAVPVFGVENRYPQVRLLPTLDPYVPMLNGALVAVESNAGTLTFLGKYGDKGPGIIC